MTFKRDLAQSVVSTVTSSQATAQGARGAQLAEITVPRLFIGRSLGDLDVRREYGLSVLMIRHSNGSVTTAPDAIAVFAEGDVMIALARAADVTRFSQLGES